MNILYSEFSDYVGIQTQKWVYSICMDTCSEFSAVRICNKHRDGYTALVPIRIVTFVPE